jgi:hypothetical protein
MLKSGVRIIEKRDLCYVAGKDGSVRRYKPWLGDSFSFLYDFIMKRSVFPGKFGGDVGVHNDILSRVLKDVRARQVRVQRPRARAKQKEEHHPREAVQ